MIGGILWRQKLAKKVSCDEIYSKSEIDPHTNELYLDFCHPSSSEKLSCYDKDFCSAVQTPEYAEDLAKGEYTPCESPDDALKKRCSAVPPGSGGTTVIGEEIIFMDLRDSVCQVSQALGEAKKGDWIGTATIAAETVCSWP